MSEKTERFDPERQADSTPMPMGGAAGPGLRAVYVGGSVDGGGGIFCGGGGAFCFDPWESFAGSANVVVRGRLGYGKSTLVKAYLEREGDR
ncbi:MAG: hypothetical protein ABSG43_03420 [Solirubrobacteraceae bacterium]